MSPEAPSLPDRKSTFSLLSAFNKLGGLVLSQKESVSHFDPNKEYGASVKSDDHSQTILKFLCDALQSMQVGVDEHLKNWSLSAHFLGKGVLDSESTYTNLRLLPENDVLKIRLFNRFIGQEFFRITSHDIIDHELSRFQKFTNPFFDKLQVAVAQLARICGHQDTPDPILWPTHGARGEERELLLRRIERWREYFLSLPPLKKAQQFFSAETFKGYNGVFSEYFHIQRQFDSDNWQDFDENNKPYSQPIPRIIAYRKVILELNGEFRESEANISMCYDYCRLKLSSIIAYLRSAEDAFLKIVNRLDDDYPVEVDYGHRVLHGRAKELKHMLFPMRCLFFEELDELRGVKESNDNTLDSYFEMSLGHQAVSIPPHYRHPFEPDQLEPDLQKAILDMTSPIPGGLDHFRDPKDNMLSTLSLIEAVQSLPLEKNVQISPVFDKISAAYEQQFKSDENNLSRRLARLLWLFTSALAKQTTLKAACQKRLDSVNTTSKVYAERAAVLKGVDLADEAVYMKLEDNKLPMLSTPEQMEDLYHTRRTVARLAVENSDFEQQALQIEKGLAAALDMLKKSEQFLTHLVQRIFPDEKDRRDLTEVVLKLIGLSYKTQQALADATKRAMLSRKKKDSNLEKKLAQEAQEIRRLKAEVQQTQASLKQILEEKQKLVQRMRITETEKKGYLKRLRMITVMTINSMSAQEQAQTGAQLQEG